MMEHNKHDSDSLSACGRAEWRGQRFSGEAENSSLSLSVLPETSFSIFPVP